ncbi:PAH-inducible cytochrome P450 monooxygenase PC-PAH 1, partial [Ramaria rubella]
IQYVLNTCGYTFHRKDTAKLFTMLTGPSLLAPTGPDHSRQRKILLPSFSHGILRENVSLFMQTAQKASGKMQELVQAGGNSSCVVDVYFWLSRLGLDAVGHGAFNHDFRALDDTPNEFVDAYRKIFAADIRVPTDAEIASGAVMRFIPIWVIPMLRLLPLGRGMQSLIDFQTETKKIASTIVDREIQALAGGLPLGKDVMSSLVRANMSETPKNKMNDDELLSQMIALMIAGHDTTSSSLVWLFYELSRHPEVQQKLREEIRTTRASANGELKAAEFDLMPYTIAVIKESLRYHPVAPQIGRGAGRDELIPLSRPVKTASGDETHTIPIKKDENIIISIRAYNRIRSLWGDDADEWNPERFLRDDRPKTSLGVHANLATFGSGVYSCPGWRFAILEIQAVLITLIENFEFSPPPNNPTIIRTVGMTTMSVVKGEETRGPQMPLTITPIN